MPADLESCVQQVLQKQPDLDESNAYAICQNAVGKVRDVSRTGQLATFEDSGRFYIKAFLLDASVNINEWGVTTPSLAKNIQSFVGKPLVLTESFDHPVPSGAGGDSLEHWLAYQETYRIGTIVDVVAKDTAYYALIEITNEDAKKAFRSGALPTYVSPAIAQNAGDPAEAIANWTGVHLAIVDDPAYTVKKATINASCGGDSIDCLLHLRKAKVQRDGIGCGFCPNEILTKRFSSHSNTNDQKPMGKLQDPNTVITNNEDASKAREETVPKSQYEELQKKLADSELKVKELTETNQSISAQVAEIQLERRREKIERIITADIIKDEKRRADKVQAMTASSIPVSEIEELYKDAVVVRKASVDINNKPARAHVTLGGSSESSDAELNAERARKLATVATGVL